MCATDLVSGELWHDESVCLGSKLANLRLEEKYKHTLSHKLVTHLAGIWNLYLKPAVFWWWILWEFLALSIFLCKFKAITLVNLSAKTFFSCKGPDKPEWALICLTKYFLSLCLISFFKLDKEKTVVLFFGILAVSIWGNNPTIYQESIKDWRCGLLNVEKPK